MQIIIVSPFIMELPLFNYFYVDLRITIYLTYYYNVYVAETRKFQLFEIILRVHTHIKPHFFYFCVMYDYEL